MVLSLDDAVPYLFFPVVGAFDEEAVDPVAVADTVDTAVVAAAAEVRMVKTLVRPWPSPFGAPAASFFETVLARSSSAFASSTALFLCSQIRSIQPCRSLSDMPSYSCSSRASRMSSAA